VSSRARAAGFAIAAVLCAIASAGIAAGYSDSVEQQLGELRRVVVVSDPLEAGETIGRDTVRRRFELREVPVRFAPPDAIAEPAAAIGRETAIPIPAGSYLMVSQLESARSPGEEQSAIAPGTDLQPIEIGVTGAGALASLGPTAGQLHVDVAVATQPNGVNGRVDVVAANVRLIALVERPSEAISGETADWTATLAVNRETALRLIEAESFAGEIRLIPRG